MLPLREFWRRNKRKILITAGVLGSGYAIYKLYSAHRRKFAELERQHVAERASEELVKAQMQAHFDNVQAISETLTLPHAVNSISRRIAEELDHSKIIDSLMKAKGQLSNSESLRLWEELKVLSFTRLVVSLWTVIIITLYVRVQMNILSRHLYLDIAQGLGSSDSLEDQDLVGWDDQEKFLSSADYLSNRGLLGLISSFQAVVLDVLKVKQLKDSFTTPSLAETITQILDIFMGAGRPLHWVGYLMPESNLASQPPSEDGNTTLHALMEEARAVLSSEEFGVVVQACFKVLVDALACDIMEQFSSDVAAAASGGVALAKLLPRVAQMGSPLLHEVSSNRYVHMIRRVPQVEPFFTLLYANVASPP